MSCEKYMPYIRVKDYLVEHPCLRYLFLELTTQCNLKCRHCGSSCPEKEEYFQVETDVLFRVIDEVAERTNGGELMFCITGGEPLLRSDWNTIGKYISEKGFSWGMTTNGTLITSEVVQLMKDSGMQTIAVSLDGLQENHEWLRRTKGCFKRAVNGIRLLVESQAFRCVQVTTVVNPRNIQELPKIYDFLVELGVDSWKIVPTEPIGAAVGQEGLFLSMEQHLDLLEYIYKIREDSPIEVTYGCSHFLPEKYEKKVRDIRFNCGAGTFIASISARGNVLACLDIDDREKTCQGNIYSEKFWDIWHKRFEIFRKPRDLSNDTCRNCTEKAFCRGDSWHTWDFTAQKPRICLRNLNVKGRV